ncbi:hypothetical protein F4678DRAFT_435748 [Xylaria arbuscula]|nr:hypothetical protein F4678DRAFT_435748 [Xylaria arbuscula]
MPGSSHLSKRPKCSLKPRVLVYDVASDSCSIKKEQKFQKTPDSKDYLPFTMKPQTRSGDDNVDLYLNKKEDTAVAVGPNSLPPRDSNHLAGLRLDKLGLKGKLLRKAGALNNGYVVKPSGSK